MFAITYNFCEKNQLTKELILKKIQTDFPTAEYLISREKYQNHSTDFHIHVFLNFKMINKKTTTGTFHKFAIPNQQNDLIKPHYFRGVKKQNTIIGYFCKEDNEFFTNINEKRIDEFAKAYYQRKSFFLNKEEQEKEQEEEKRKNLEKESLTNEKDFLKTKNVLFLGKTDLKKKRKILDFYDESNHTYKVIENKLDFIDSEDIKTFLFDNPSSYSIIMNVINKNLLRDKDYLLRKIHNKIVKKPTNTNIIMFKEEKEDQNRFIKKLIEDGNFLVIENISDHKNIHIETLNIQTMNNSNYFENSNNIEMKQLKEKYNLLAQKVDSLEKLLKEKIEREN